MYVKIDENGDPISGMILPENLEYILGTKEITSELLTENGYAEVLHPHGPDPDVIGVGTDKNWEGTDNIIKNDDGTYEREWIVETIDVAEKVRRWILGPREQRLFKTDWTQMNDSPLSDEDKAAWATYRAALRSITDDNDLANMSSPEEIDWPTPPGPLDGSGIGGKWEQAPAPDPE